MHVILVTKVALNFNNTICDHVYYLGSSLTHRLILWAEYFFHFSFRYSFSYRWWHPLVCEIFPRELY